MTMECYYRNCKYHGDPNQGPFCHEPFCRNENELVRIWPDDTSLSMGDDASWLSDDYIVAVVNDDGSIPTYNEAIRR